MINLSEAFKKHKLTISLACVLTICVIGGMVLTKPNDEQPLSLDAALATITLENYPHSSEEAIENFKEYIKAQPSENVTLILNDKELVYGMLMDSYWVKEETPTLKPITFPAYKQDNPQDSPHINKINNTPKFQVIADFPENWTLKNTKGNETTPTGEFYTPVYIYDGDNLIGYIGFNRFEPYTDEIEPEDYYKTVWTPLRLSSFFNWEPYTAVTANETGETGIADIWYLDPDEIDKHPGALASVPTLETVGILSYDKKLGVYIGIAFMPNTISREQAEMIAKSVAIVPHQDSKTTAHGLDITNSWENLSYEEYISAAIKEKGLTEGEIQSLENMGLSRFDIQDMNKDELSKKLNEHKNNLPVYMKFEIIDSNGEDISNILSDLWWNANNIYNVDSDIGLKLGHPIDLLGAGPEFYEFINYEPAVKNIFSANGIKQLENTKIGSDITTFLQKRDGKIYRLGSWKTGYNYEDNLHTMITKSVTDNKITVEAQYEIPTSIEARESPNYMPQYQSVNFIVVKENGMWLVEDYRFPESK